MLASLARDGGTSANEQASGRMSMVSRQPWVEFDQEADPMELLVALSRYYGADDEFILAGGGNTSMKIGDRLHVKASGHALATIEPEGFVEIDRTALDALLERDLGGDVDEREQLFKDAILAARIEPGKNQRPSVEVVLHHLLPGRYVVHSHPGLVCGFTCCDRGEEILHELFGAEIIWIPFVDPGFVLANRIHTSLAEHAERTGVTNPVVMLQNHGLIVNGETPDDVRRTTDAILAKLAARLAEADDGGTAFGEVSRVDAETATSLRGVIEPVLAVMAGAEQPPRALQFHDSETVLSLVGGAEGKETAALGPLSPDQIVYCKSFPLWFDPVEGEAPDQTAQRLHGAIEQHQTDTQFLPLVVLVGGVGLYGVGEGDSDAANAAALYIDAIQVMARARKLGGIRYMTKRDREFIDHWEVESYRRQIAKGG
jgi:rhamnose utilization protein RhaD (predicted bifunctional aldolase and dehydrogenase)